MFHDVKTGETVIAYRGTDPGSFNINEIEKTKLPHFSDLKTDGAILIGQEAKTARSLEAEKTFQKTVNKYGNERVHFSLFVITIERQLTTYGFNVLRVNNSATILGCVSGCVFVIEGQTLPQGRAL